LAGTANFTLRATNSAGNAHKGLLAHYRSGCAADSDSACTQGVCEGGRIRLLSIPLLSPVNRQTEHGLDGIAGAQAVLARGHLCAELRLGGVWHGEPRPSHRCQLCAQRSTFALVNQDTPGRCCSSTGVCLDARRRVRRGRVRCRLWSSARGTFRLQTKPRYRKKI
jgi:hypothetical protein